MGSDDKTGDDVSVILGDEYDDSLRIKLSEALVQLGASLQGAPNKSLAGSQELEEYEVYVEGQIIRIEAETYIGLSITGPSNIVHHIQEIIQGTKL